MLALRLAPTVLIAVAISSCGTTTQYAPRPSEQLRLVLVRDDLGAVTPALTDGYAVYRVTDDIVGAVRCDVYARRSGRQAQEAFRAERTLRGLAIASVFLAPPLVPLILPVAAGLRQHAHARLVDAVVYQGGPACQGEGS